MAGRYFLVYLTFTWCLVAGKPPKYGLKGNKVLLETDIPGQPDAILWKHNGNKVIEFNGNEERIYGLYIDRITLDWVSAALEIRDLKFEDSGGYELDVDINKRLHRSVHQLEVIDEVAKPTISCEMIDGGSSNKSGKLVCSAEPRQPQSLIEFEWESNGKAQPGANLLIPLGEKHDDKVHSCNVSNPLSSKTATFTAKDCHSDGSSVALIASLVSIILFGLLVGLALLLFCKLRRKACFAEGDLEKQSPRGVTEAFDKQTARGEEKSRLLHRESTRPSHQPLHHLHSGMGGMRQDSDADSDAETVESDMDKQDEMPQKGYVLRLRDNFEKNVNPTMPTKFRREKHKEPAFPPSTPPSEPPSPLDQNNLASSGKGYLDTYQLGEPTEGKVPQFNLSDAEKENEADPASVSDDLNEDTNSDHSIVAEQPGPDKEADEDEDEEAQRAPSNADTPPVAQPRSLLTKSSPNMAPKDAAGEHKEDANSDQVTEETAEKYARESDSSGEEERNESDDSSKDMESPNVPEQKEPDKEPDEDEDEDEEAQPAPSNAATPPVAQPRTALTESSPNMAPKDAAGEHKEDANSDQVTEETAEKNVRESDSSGEEERNESDDSSKDIESPTVPEQKGSKTSLDKQELPREEAHTSEDNQQETVKPLSEVESDKDSVGESEEATSPQPQSPPPTEPDNRNTDTSQKSPDAAHADPCREEEDKTSHDSAEQSDEGEAETGKDKNEVQSGPKEDKPDNESLSEDKGQKKNEVVA